MVRLEGMMPNLLSTYLSKKKVEEWLVYHRLYDLCHWSSLVMTGMLQSVGEIWLPMVDPCICCRHMSMTLTMPVLKEVLMMSLRCLRWMVLV